VALRAGRGGHAAARSAALERRAAERGVVLRAGRGGCASARSAALERRAAERGVVLRAGRGGCASARSAALERRAAERGVALRVGRGERAVSAARERVLKTASRLFYREGIRAIGVDRIAAEAEVGKMTLYRHFATKDDLVVAVLEARDGPALAALTTAIERAGDDPRARLLAPFAMLEPWFTSRGFRGCPFMNAALELHDLDHPARAVAHRHKAMTRDAFAKTAAAAGLTRAKAGALADQLALVFDGAIAQAQMRDPKTVARAPRRAAAALVDAALG
jgi:AcrR family transcriptional regulator